MCMPACLLLLPLARDGRLVSTCPAPPLQPTQHPDPPHPPPSTHIHRYQSLALTHRHQSPTTPHSQVRRLQSHPCIALWGGNNENEIALTWFKQSTDNRDLYVVDYVELYINTLHRVVRTLDPARAWVDSSPANGLISQVGECVCKCMYVYLM